LPGFASFLCITLLLAGFLAILCDPIPTRLELARALALSSAVLIFSGMLVLTLLIYSSYTGERPHRRFFPDFSAVRANQCEIITG
jgi:predicted PurR-regulated permease PerM